MESIDPKRWAQQLSDDLIVGDERVPFERVLRQHVDALQELRSQGLTWASLGRLLGAAGARRSDGSLYSGDHLRVSFQRLQAVESHRLQPGAALRARRRKVDEADPAALMTTSSRPSPPNKSEPTFEFERLSLQRAAGEQRSTSTSKDITDDEIADALDRLNRTRS